MMKAMTANLPQGLRQRLHADFLANEQAYLQMRDALRQQFPGQWVAVADGKVIAAADNLVTLTDISAQSGKHAFIAKVGEEDRTIFRMRRADFSYLRAMSLSRCLALRGVCRMPSRSFW